MSQGQAKAHHNGQMYIFSRGQAAHTFTLPLFTLYLLTLLHFALLSEAGIFYVFIYITDITMPLATILLRRRRDDRDDDAR